MYFLFIYYSINLAIYIADIINDIKEQPTCTQYQFLSEKGSTNNSNKLKINLPIEIIPEIDKYSIN